LPVCGQQCLAVQVAGQVAIQIAELLLKALAKAGTSIQAAVAHDYESRAIGGDGCREDSAAILLTVQAGAVGGTESRYFFSEIIGPRSRTFAQESSADGFSLLIGRALRILYPFVDRALVKRSTRLRS
jgi:hypothetical protein